MRLHSPAFESEGVIPPKHTQEGGNLSPPLRWEDVPHHAAELVLVLEDVDAPREDPFVHWVVYKIPADSEGLPAGVPPNDQLTYPPGTVQGASDFPAPTIGYHGPAPSEGDGLHHYRFRLYALDEPLNLSAGQTSTVLMEAMKGHVLAETTLIARYERR